MSALVSRFGSHPQVTDVNARAPPPVVAAAVEHESLLQGIVDVLQVSDGGAVGRRGGGTHQTWPVPSVVGGVGAAPVPHGDLVVDNLADGLAEAAAVARS